MFPTGNLVDRPRSAGRRHARRRRMINAGIPTIFVNADAIGYTGTELQDAINGDTQGAGDVRDHPRPRCGAHGPDPAHRRSRQAPAHPESCVRRAAGRLHCLPAASGSRPADIDVLVRALSMGKLHHAMMGTAAVAIGTAAAIPGTLVNLAAGGGDARRGALRPSVGHAARRRRGEPVSTANGPCTKAIMSRSARVLMEGWVRVPGDAF